MDDRILAENQVEAARLEGQGAGLDQPIVDPIGEPFLGRAPTRPRDIVGLDIDAEDMARAESLRQQQVDAADAAADIEHPRPADVPSTERRLDLRRPAGREEALAPDELERGHHGIAIFGRVGRLHPRPSS